MSELNPSDDSLEPQILQALEDHTPWNMIAKKFRVSTKTISAIRAKHQKAAGEDRMASKVFKLLGAGMAPDLIVVKLRVHPDTVLKLVEQYEKLKEHTSEFCNHCFCEGERSGLKYALIKSPCAAGCGRNVEFDLLEDSDRRIIMEILRRGGIDEWRHTTCK
jgi:hypothetical protein